MIKKNLTDEYVFKTSTILFKWSWKREKTQNKFYIKSDSCCSISKQLSFIIFPKFIFIFCKLLNLAFTIF